MAVAQCQDEMQGAGGLAVGGCGFLDRRSVTCGSW